MKAKGFFRFAVAVLAVFYVAAHVAIRTGWGGRKALACLSRATGNRYGVTAERVRFTPGLSLSLREARVRCGDRADAPLVFSAPRLVLSLRCRGIRAKAEGATLRAALDPAGKWSPAVAEALGDGPVDVYSFGKVSPAFGKLFFSIENSGLEVVSGGKTVVFSGLSWIRRPVGLEGHPRAVQNRVSYSAGPVWAYDDEWDPPLGTRDEMSAEDEWFELEDEAGVLRLFGENRPNGPRIVSRIVVKDPVVVKKTADQAVAEVPETPETPETTKASETPEVPDVPETPESPETTETPESPEVTETPEAAEAPEAPEAPAATPPAEPPASSESPSEPAAQ